MNRLLILALAALPTPALAQHDAHAGHHPPPASADPHAGHAMPAGADPHAGHVMPAPAPTPVDPHAGHGMPTPAPAPVDPHAGHRMPPPAPVADPHAGHVMPPPPSPTATGAIPAAALTGPAYAADSVWGAAAMAASRHHLIAHHGGMAASKLLIDRLEVAVADGPDTLVWDGEAWIGGDIERLWLKSEGESSDGTTEGSAEVLWTHAIGPFFDLQAGVRHDFAPGADTTHLGLGVAGLAPYWVEVDAALFLSHRGDLTASIEAEYDLRLTQRLILQPRVELTLAAQAVAEQRIGAGLTDVEAGLRLRYAIDPHLAPYVGVGWHRAFGDTADLRRADGEAVGGWSVLIGVRSWF